MYASGLPRCRPARRRPPRAPDRARTSPSWNRIRCTRRTPAHRSARCHCHRRSGDDHPSSASRLPCTMPRTGPDSSSLRGRRACLAAMSRVNRTPAAIFPRSAWPQRRTPPGMSPRRKSDRRTPLRPAIARPRRTSAGCSRSNEPGPSCRTRTPPPRTRACSSPWSATLPSHRNAATCPRRGIASARVRTRRCRPRRRDRRSAPRKALHRSPIGSRHRSAADDSRSNADPPSCSCRCRPCRPAQGRKGSSLPSVPWHRRSAACSRGSACRARIRPRKPPSGTSYRRTPPRLAIARPSRRSGACCLRSRRRKARRPRIRRRRMRARTCRGPAIPLSRHSSGASCRPCTRDRPARTRRRRSPGRDRRSDGSKDRRDPPIDRMHCIAAECSRRSAGPRRCSCSSRRRRLHPHRTASRPPIVRRRRTSAVCCRGSACRGSIHPRTQQSARSDPLRTFDPRTPRVASDTSPRRRSRARSQHIAAPPRRIRSRTPRSRGPRRTRPPPSRVEATRP